jgi:hypothetical protein
MKVPKDVARARAESELRRAQKAERASDASKAMLERDAAIRAADEKTARLKALRLARDEAAVKEAAAAKAKPKPAAKKKVAKRAG